MAASALSEPADGAFPPRWRTRWWAVPLAIGLATVGVLMAPDPWSEGEGKLSVQIDGLAAQEGPVLVGHAQEQTLRWDTAGETAVTLASRRAAQWVGNVESCDGRCR